MPRLKALFASFAVAEGEMDKVDVVDEMDVVD